jgi:hypothetical protein
VANLAKEAPQPLTRDKSNFKKEFKIEWGICVFGISRSIII